MTRFFFTLSIIMISFTEIISAQDQLLLSSYTFSSDNNRVGEIHSGFSDKLRLKGKNARLFKIENGWLVARTDRIPDHIKSLDVKIVSREMKTKSVFTIVRDEFHQNKVIAHRGAWKNTGAAENSIRALTEAIKMGCGGSEFDVHMSADSVLVVNHDPSFNGVKIDASSALEISSLKLSNGENLPTLRAYIEEGIKQNKTKLILEIKSTSDRERMKQMTRKVVQLVRELKAQAWIDYISFDYTSCLEIRQIDPFARVAYLTGDKSPIAISDDQLWGIDYHFDVFRKNPEWIMEAKNKGLTINTWTVNDPEMMNWFLSKNVDFITTNEPEILLEIIKNKNH